MRSKSRARVEALDRQRSERELTHAQALMQTTGKGVSVLDEKKTQAPGTKEIQGGSY